MALTLNAHSVVFFDTAPFIYLLQNHPTFGKPVVDVLNTIYAAECRIITSVLTYLELTTKPLKDGDNAQVARLRDYLLRSEYLELLPMDVSIAEEAARLRAQHNFKTPDAIQLATAITHGADYVLTNDQQWNRITQTTIVQVSNL